jgi:hypothetical protein
MPSFLDSVKLRSLGLWPAVLGIAVPLGLGSATTGCFFDSDDEEVVIVEDDPYNHPQTTDPILVKIDPDATMDASPGEGAGLFVEYALGGHWTLWTTCDTNYPPYRECAFDAVVSVDTASEVLAATGADLEGTDLVDDHYAQGTVRFRADTGTDIDSMWLDTTPGAIVRLDLMLDGVSETRFVYWIGNGVLHAGAPSNPVDFEPLAP